MLTQRWIAPSSDRSLYKNAGITTTAMQLKLTFINACISFLGAILGASFLGKASSRCCEWTRADQPPSLLQTMSVDGEFSWVVSRPFSSS